MHIPDLAALFRYIPKLGRRSARFRIRKYDLFRHASTPECDGFVHEKSTAMATIKQLSSGRLQVQIRLRRREATETFLRHDHARERATETKAKVDHGRAPSGCRAKIFGALTDLPKAVGKMPGRSKSTTAKMLQQRLGALQNLAAPGDRRSLRNGNPVAPQLVAALGKVLRLFA
ncbi:MAG: hypothetical protein WDM91_12035 [Rhizomicrobium sp.]